jgi:hypothetical protein
MSLAAAGLQGLHVNRPPMPLAKATMESSLGLVRSFRVLPSSSGRCSFALARAETLATTKIAAAPPMRFAPLQRLPTRGSGLMTGFASPGRLRLQVFSTSWRLDPPRACRPCFMPDPLMGLHPPELSSSRVAVRRFQRLSPHVVGCFRRTCLTDESRRAPNPNAETMEPVVQRRTPFAVPRCRNSLTRRPTPVGSPELRLPPPKRRLPSFDTRTPNPVSRCRNTEARSPTPDEHPNPRPDTEAPHPVFTRPLQRPAPKPDAETPSPSPDTTRHRTPNPRRRNAEHPSKPQHRSAGPPSHPHRRNATNPPGTRHRGATRSPCPRHRSGADPPSSQAPETAAEAPASFARFEHRLPNAEAPRTRRDPNAEAPEPLRTRNAETPRILRARDTEVPCAHRARAAETVRARRSKTGNHRVEQARGSLPAFRGLLRARVRHSPPAV